MLVNLAAEPKPEPPNPITHIFRINVSDDTLVRVLALASVRAPLYLGVLGRMLRLAVRNGKLTRLPDFRDLKPKEAAPRSGFFEDHQYEAIRRHLPEDLRPAVTIAHTYGWRT